MEKESDNDSIAYYKLTGGMLILCQARIYGYLENHVSLPDTINWDDINCTSCVHKQLNKWCSQLIDFVDVINVCQG